MKHTGRQTTTATITDMYRAMDHKQPVSITYLREETRDVIAVNSKGVATRRTIRTGHMVETIRTIEIHGLITTTAGDIVIKAMDRETREWRSFRLDRITAYTRHTGATYQVAIPTEDTPATVRPIVRSVAQMVALELGRDYQPTTRTRTALAA